MDFRIGILSSNFLGYNFSIQPFELFDSPDAQKFEFTNWLDLGAGDGGALMRGVKPLAKEISTTEICPVMRKRLEWRGFAVEDVNGWRKKKWKMISMLNLLDRAGNPDDFLANATEAIDDGALKCDSDRNLSVL